MNDELIVADQAASHQSTAARRLPLPSLYNLWSLDLWL